MDANDGCSSSGGEPPRWPKFLGVIALLLSGAALIVSFSILLRRGVLTAPDNPPALVPEKSIAVLPFENLSSEEKTNAYFADGIQDEILTRLIEDRRPKGHFSHIHPALQERAGKPA